MPNKSRGILDLIPGLAGPSITVISGIRGIRGSIGAPPASPIPVQPDSQVRAYVTMTNSGALPITVSIKLDLKAAQASQWSVSEADMDVVEFAAGERKEVILGRAIPTGYGDNQGIWARVEVKVGTGEWTTKENTGELGAAGYVWIMRRGDAAWLTDITVQYGVV